MVDAPEGAKAWCRSSPSRASPTGDDPARRQAAYPVGTGARPERPTAQETLMFRHHDKDDDGPGPNVYQMRQQMFSIGDDYWIENGAGQRAIRVDGKALRVRKTLVLENTSGQELYTIKEKLVTVRDVMTIERGGATVATVKKALISPLRERFDVEFERGGHWKVQGNIVDHQYEIESDSGPIAEVGKKWFRVRDTYGVKVAPGQDDALVLAVTVVVDTMAHPHR
jgi:uncharacterized protein YxjI